MKAIPRSLKTALLLLAGRKERPNRVPQITIKENDKVELHKAAPQAGENPKTSKQQKQTKT
jgi:hypothetical protein